MKDLHDAGHHLAQLADIGRHGIDLPVEAAQIFERQISTFSAMIGIVAGLAVERKEAAKDDKGVSVTTACAPCLS